MISHKHKFILITPPKTGSVSCSNFFMKFCDISEVIAQEGDNFEYIDEAPPNPDYKYIESKHHTLQNYANIVDLSQYTIIGTIRNPYDRCVSFWRWSNKQKKRMWLEGLRFTWWLRRLQVAHWARQSLIDYYTVDNKINVDFFIDVNTINQDIEKVCNYLNLPFSEVPHLNKTKYRKHYRKYYSKTSKRLVDSMFLKDIQYFNYKF